MPFQIPRHHTLPETQPGSLCLLQQPHVMRLDVERFWSDLSAALPLNKQQRGRGFGLSWSFTNVNPELMRAYIPVLGLSSYPNLDGGIAWMTLRMDGECIVIIHYVVGNTVISDTLWVEVNYGLIASSTFIIAKLRLIGDQIIQAAADRHAARHCNK